MPTFKNCKPEVLTTLAQYHADQKKLQEMLNAWALKFGMHSAVLRERSLDMTYFSGFQGVPEAVAPYLWRNASPDKWAKPEYILRSGLPKGQSSPERLARLRDLKTLWAKMCAEVPFEHLEVSAVPVMQVMGFGNYLSLVGMGRISMCFTPESVLLSIEHTPEACRVPDNGWIEILGSEYEAELAAAKLEEAHRRAAKEAAKKAMGEMTAQSQGGGSCD